LAESVIGYEMP